MQARKFLELLFDLLMPSAATYTPPRIKVEVIIKVFVLLCLAGIVGFYLGLRAPH